jgi:hypothetical protein
MLFVPERRRSRRLLSAIRSERSEQSNPGSRDAMLSEAGAPLSWTNEGADAFWSASE